MNLLSSQKQTDELFETTIPFLRAAEAMKRRLIEMGWGEEMSEAVAADWLRGVFHAGFSGLASAS